MLCISVASFHSGLNSLSEICVAESLTGQFHERLSEQFDLMIKGKGLNELKKYRSELIGRGIAAGEIPDETFFGHHLFCLKDPDGNGITIYTSHAIQ